MTKLQEFIEQVRGRIEKATPGPYGLIREESYNRVCLDLEIALAVIEKQITLVQRVSDSMQCRCYEYLNGAKCLGCTARNCLAACEKILEKA